MIRTYARVLLILFAIFTILSIFTCDAEAGGYLFSEQGQPSIGTASVGQAALADDASTTFFNPAGMARLEKNELLLGSQMMLTSMEFRVDGDNTARGSEGGQAGGFYPGGGFYYSLRLTDQFSAGVCMNAPSAAGFEYHRNWAGRYYVQKLFFMAANFNPVVSFRVNDWLSLGAGVSAIYGMFKQDIALPQPGAGDGRASLDLDDWSHGYNLGILVEPGSFHKALEGTRIGVAYRSQVNLNLHGQVDIRNFGPAWTQAQLDNAFAKTTLILPRNITVSVYQQLLDKFAVLFDVGWQDFSQMDKTLINTGSGSTINLQRNWVDTWRLGVGAHYRVNDPFLVKCGFSYDSDPVKHKTNGMPDFPMDRQLRYAAGLDWFINEDMKLSVSYEFIDLGKAPLIQRPSPTTPTLSGDFDKNSINLISVSFNWKFDGPLPGATIKERTIDK